MDNKRERKQTTAHIVAKFYPLYLAVKICRYGSLTKINPFGEINPYAVEKFPLFHYDMSRDSDHVADVYLRTSQFVYPYETAEKKNGNTPTWVKYFEKVVDCKI